METIKTPRQIQNLIKYSLQAWSINLIYKGKNLKNIKIEKGILQGDSLSPLLFVMCLEPISREANKEHTPKLKIQLDNKEMPINHLLFMDDIKLYSQSEENLRELSSIFMSNLEKIGLKVNIKKTATNCQQMADIATVIKNENTYKYLGVLENNQNLIDPKNKEDILNEIYNRIEILCKANLNSRNLFTAINEYAISVMNYYTGLISFTLHEFSRADIKIRQILSRNKVHFQPSNKERLYLPRNDFGKGLTSIEFKCEKILLGLHNYLAIGTNTNLRKQIISKIEIQENSLTIRIPGLLRGK